MKPNFTTLFILSSLLLLSTSPLSHALSFYQLRTLISLSSSLMSRVATARAMRGDVAGSERARAIAQKLDGLMWPWRGVWAMGWDYARNYAWRDVPVREWVGSASDATELLRVLNEFTRLGSDTERAGWVLRNYKTVLEIGESVLRRLHRVFAQSGAMREVVEVLQREVQEGDLLKDCIEVGIGDLKGLVQIVKEIGLQFSTGNQHENFDL